MVQRFKFFHSRSLDLVGALDGLFGKAEPKDGGDVGHAERIAFFAGEIFDLVSQPMGFRFEGSIQPGLEQLLQGGMTSRHGDGVGTEGARLINGPFGSDVAHDFGGSSVGADGHAPPDDFAEGGDVGSNAVMTGRPLETYPKPGNHFIENEQSAVLGTEAPQEREEIGALQEQAVVGGHGLDDGAGQLMPVGLESGFQTLGIRQGQDEGVRDDGRWNPRRSAGAEGGQAASGPDQQGVHVTVVAALEFENLVPPGHPPGQANGRHDGLGARADEAQHLHIAVVVQNETAQPIAQLAGRSERGAAPHRLQHGYEHFGVGMPQDEGPPGTTEVQVGIAVGVLDAAARPPVDEQRRADDGFEGSHRGMHTPGEHLFGFFEQGCRFPTAEALFDFHAAKIFFVGGWKGTPPKRPSPQPPHPKGQGEGGGLERVC